MVVVKVGMAAMVTKGRLGMEGSRPARGSHPHCCPLPPGGLRNMAADLTKRGTDKNRFKKAEVSRKGDPFLLGQVHSTQL